MSPILWFDVETERVKIAKHAKFDEGMNDLDINSIPPNVQQLQRSDDGVRPEKDPKEITVDEFLDPMSRIRGCVIANLYYIIIYHTYDSYAGSKRRF